MAQGPPQKNMCVSANGLKKIRIGSHVDVHPPPPRCMSSFCLHENSTYFIPKLSYKLPIQMCPSIWKVDAPSTFLPTATDTLTVLKSTGPCTSSNSSNKVLLCETDRTIFFPSSLWLHLCNLIAKTEAMLFEVKHLIPGIGILISKAF